MFGKGTTVVSGDARLFVSEAGNPDGPPIVLLHGGLGSRDDFEALGALLATDYRLVAIDNRGHGRSSLGQTALTYRRLAEDVVAVLAQLGLTSAGIIGQSDGGILALRLAAFGLCRPCFIVAVGVHWHLPDDDPTRAIFQEVSAAEWREMFGPQVARYEAENPDPDFSRLFDATKAMWLGTGPDAYPGEAIRDIDVPLLVVHGDDDFLVSRAQSFELAERVKGARLLNLPFASHTVLEDDPDAVAPALVSFISSVNESARVAP